MNFMQQNRNATALALGHCALLDIVCIYQANPSFPGADLDNGTEYRGDL